MGHTTVLLIAIATMLLGYRTGATPAIRPLSQRGIIFPTENYDDCFVDAHRTVRGICKKLADCPTAVERWEHEKLRPQTCYFIKFEHIVCCEKNELKDEHIQEKEKKTTHFPATTTTTTTPRTTTLTTTTTTTRTTPTTTTTPPKPTTTTKTPYHDIHEKRSSEIACQSYVDAKDNKDEDSFETTTGYNDAIESNEFSYMAAIGWRSKFDAQVIYFHCGGALISPQFVMTAAHCVELGGEPAAVARIGGVDLTDDHQLATDYEIRRSILHPAYNVSIVNNDIALLELKRAAVQHIPACLWTKPELAHEDVIAVGYGQTRLASSATIQLLQVPLSVFSNEACKAYFETPSELSLIRETVSGVDGSSSSSSSGSISNNRRTHICAGDAANLRDTCQGDAGGPLIVQTPHHYIVGITAFGFGCAGGPPSVYTRTAAYIEWLEEVVWPAKAVTLIASTSTPLMTTTPLLDVRVNV